MCIGFLFGCRSFVTRFHCLIHSKYFVSIRFINSTHTHTQTHPSLIKRYAGLNDSIILLSSILNSWVALTIFLSITRAHYKLTRTVGMFMSQNVLLSTLSWVIESFLKAFHSQPKQSHRQ